MLSYQLTSELVHAHQAELRRLSSGAGRVDGGAFEWTVTESASEPVTVSRRIEASAHDVFAVVADPANHPIMDGSGMLRAGPPARVITAVGDVFAMQMYLSGLGEYVMLNRVVEYERDRRLVWEPTPGDRVAAAEAQLPIGASQGYRWGFELVPNGPDATTVTEVFDCSAASAEIRAAVDNGRRWVASITKTLDRLEQFFK